MSAATTRIPEVVIKLPRVVASAGRLGGAIYKFRVARGVLNADPVGITLPGAARILSLSDQSDGFFLEDFHINDRRIYSTGARVEKERRAKHAASALRHAVPVLSPGDVVELSIRPDLLGCAHCDRCGEFDPGRRDRDFKVDLTGVFV